jgi:hypothetical protein
MALKLIDNCKGHLGLSSFDDDTAPAAGDNWFAVQGALRMRSAAKIITIPKRCFAIPPTSFVKCDILLASNT